MRDMVVLISLDNAACRTMARKLRAGQVYCKILPADVTVEDLLAQNALGVLLAGGSKGEPEVIPQLEGLLSHDLPLMAMGDAALTLCQALGGEPGGKEDAGVATVTFKSAPELFDGMESDERYLPVHRTLIPAGKGVIPLARTDKGILGLRDEARPVYALGLQAERNDPISSQLLINFCKNVCGCTLWWNNRAFIDRAIEEISHAAGEGSALCAISGGVDSGVCALLGNMALGQRLHCIFIDTGLLRDGESDSVMHFYRDQMGLNVYRIDVREQVLSALKGINTPAEKEEVISSCLKGLMKREAMMIPDVTLLIQGTTFSDMHDDQDASLEELQDRVRLAEPVRELFKDEIRRIAADVGMPPEIINRQPFPGSGLALRIMADVTEERLAILQAADAIFRKEIEDANQHKRLWQYYASLALSPYSEDGYVITLRAVQAVEGAAAMPARLPSDLLERVSLQIRSTLPQVGRVLYDLTPSRTWARNEGK